MRSVRCFSNFGRLRSWRTANYCQSTNLVHLKKVQALSKQEASRSLLVDQPEKDHLAATQRIPVHKPNTIQLEAEPKMKVDIGLTEAVKLETRAYDLLNSIREDTDYFEFKAKVAEAIETFKKALAANPHFLQIPHLYHGLALCYTRLTEWNKVIEYNQLALDSDADFVPAYESIGEAYQMQKEFKLALTWYTKFFDTFPEYYSAIDHQYKDPRASAEILGQLLFKRGICYYEIYDYEMAAGDFNTCVEVESKFAYAALNWLGRIAAEHGKYWDCVSLNTKCLERNPKCLAAYYDRNNAYEMLGKTKEAEEDMKMFNFLKRQLVWKKQDQLHATRGPASE